MTFDSTPTPAQIRHLSVTPTGEFVNVPDGYDWAFTVPGVLSNGREGIMTVFQCKACSSLTVIPLFHTRWHEEQASQQKS